jgi:hypothetical protein
MGLGNKMSVKNLLLGVVAAAALMAGAAHAADTLTGDTVDINLTAGGIDYGTQTVLVGAGYDASYFSNQYIDANAGVDGDLFTVYTTANYCGISYCSFGDVYWTLSNLNFAAPLTGLTFLSSPAAVTIDYLTATSVQFHYFDTNISGTYLQARFETGSVPEPATWALMIGGFGMAGAMMRRRTAVAA